MATLEASAPGVEPVDNLDSIPISREKLDALLKSAAND
jgi:hypothetical protein